MILHQLGGKPQRLLQEEELPRKYYTDNILMQVSTTFFLFFGIAST